MRETTISGVFLVALLVCSFGVSATHAQEEDKVGAAAPTHHLHRPLPASSLGASLVPHPRPALLHPTNPCVRWIPRVTPRQEKLMGELGRLTAYTNMRYENMVYMKKVKAAVRPSSNPCVGGDTGGRTTVLDALALVVATSIEISLFVCPTWRRGDGLSPGEPVPS